MRGMLARQRMAAAWYERRSIETPCVGPQLIKIQRARSPYENKPTYER